MKGHAIPTLTLIANEFGPGTLTAQGCGYELEPAVLKYTQPDGTIDQYGVGIASEGGNCLDTNYVPATQAGDWHLDVLQEGKGHKLEVVASADITI
jgi:hypothetical protein